MPNLVDQGPIILLLTASGISRDSIFALINMKDHPICQQELFS